MADPYSKIHTHIKPLINSLAVHLTDLKTNELKSLAGNLRNYLADDLQQLHAKDGDTAKSSIDVITRLLDGYDWGSKRFKDLGENLENVLQKELKKRLSKIDSIIKKSCKVKKLTLCIKLNNPLNYKHRLEARPIENYLIESVINDQLQDKLLRCTVKELEEIAQYKPYTSSMFKDADFEYYIQKKDYLSHLYYVCISKSITKVEHLRVQLEINSADLCQDYTTLEKDFKIHKKELSKVNTILAKLGRSKYADLKDCITKINPKQDKNTAADIVFHPDNYTVMKDIKSIEDRILARANRKKAKNDRRKLRVFTFHPNQLSRRDFLSYSSSKRHELIVEFLALDDKITKKIIDSKKILKHTKSKKKHEISIPAELNKEIKKLAKKNRVEEQLLINIIFQDDNDKYQEVTERFTKPSEEKTLLITSPPLASSAKEQLPTKHAEQTIKVAIDEKQAPLEPSEQTNGTSTDDKQPSQEEPCTDKDENPQATPIHENNETAIPALSMQTGSLTSVAIENLTNALEAQRREDLEEQRRVDLEEQRRDAAIVDFVNDLQAQHEKLHTNKP